jgi:hypothetical protein
VNPIDVLREGARELESVLCPHGFEFVQIAAGPSSGGPFASGEYRRADRRLELHVRRSLGLVTYHVGRDGLSHEELMRAVFAAIGGRHTSEYPGFSSDPIDGFRHLAGDIRRFGQSFTRGTAEEFAGLVGWVSRHPKPTAAGV